MASVYLTAGLSPFSFLFLSTGLAFGTGDALDKSHSVTSAFFFEVHAFQNTGFALIHTVPVLPVAGARCRVFDLLAWSAGAVCAGVIPFPPLLVYRQVWPASRVRVAEVCGDRPGPEELLLEIRNGLGASVLVFPACI